MIGSTSDLLTDIFAWFSLSQTKERGSTRVHSLNNVNKVLQVLHQNNVSSRCVLVKYVAPTPFKSNELPLYTHYIQYTHTGSNDWFNSRLFTVQSTSCSVIFLCPFASLAHSLRHSSSSFGTMLVLNALTLTVGDKGQGMLMGNSADSCGHITPCWLVHGRSQKLSAGVEGSEKETEKELRIFLCRILFRFKYFIDQLTKKTSSICFTKTWEREYKLGFLNQHVHL